MVNEVGAATIANARERFKVISAQALPTPSQFLLCSFGVATSSVEVMAVLLRSSAPVMEFAIGDEVMEEHIEEAVPVNSDDDADRSGEDVHSDSELSGHDDPSDQLSFRCSEFRRCSREEI